jgi:hypothetical protein
MFESPTAEDPANCMIFWLTSTTRRTLRRYVGRATRRLKSAHFGDHIQNLDARHLDFGIDIRQLPQDGNPNSQ